MNKFCVFTHEIVLGCYEIELLINDQVLRYNASYIGVNPLTSLVDSCFRLDFAADEYEETDAFEWELEPNVVCFDLHLDASSILQFDIVEYDDWNPANRQLLNEWHEAVPFAMFRSAVVAEGFRVLNAFGLAGFRASWAGQTEFPLAPLLRLTGKVSIATPVDSDSYTSSIAEEVACLSAYIGKNEITEESHLGLCNIYYHAWQLQCCGEPFRVGDRVDWTCEVPSKPTNVSDIIVDFTEEHHGSETHSISGVVDKIMMERRVESPKKEQELSKHEQEMQDSAKNEKNIEGSSKSEKDVVDSSKSEKNIEDSAKNEKNIEYSAKNEKDMEDDSYYISHDEIPYADGWKECYCYPSDDKTTTRILLGYIVTLRDVVIKPLPAESNDSDNDNDNDTE